MIEAELYKRIGTCRMVEGARIRVRPGTVHALVGENGAGKSTLVKIVSGVMRADHGSLAIDGKPVELARWDRAAARAAGIGIVQQHGASAETLTVVENAVLGAEPRRAGLLALGETAAALRALGAQIGLPVDPFAPAEALSVGAAQRAEIVAALYHGAKWLLLDEPTAVLTPVEVDGLLATLRRLAAGGTAVVIVTHKLDEVRAIADEVTVLREGATVATFVATGAGAAPGGEEARPQARGGGQAAGPQAFGDDEARGQHALDGGRTDNEQAPDGRRTDEPQARGGGQADGPQALDGGRTDETQVPDGGRTDVQQAIGALRELGVAATGDRRGRFDVAAIARAMVGAELPAPSQLAPPPEDAPVALALERFSVAGLSPIDLVVREGGIVGIAGVDGNGQRELALGIAGLVPQLAGALRIGGRDARTATPAQRLAAGLAHIPEDRHHGGLILDSTVAENLALGRRDVTGRWRIDRMAVRRNAVERIIELDIRPANSDAVVRSLSGGNQQKVVVGRELSRPGLRAVVAAQPTRGVDLGAVARIHDRLRAAAQGGAGVLVISADLDELLVLCHRVLVLLRGAVVGQRAGHQLHEPEARAALGACMTGAEVRA
ncbi:MAG: ABC transporter ATP-binding protein [Kofleriaceae bacterium]